MFLRNCWYVAAWDDEVGRVPLSRTLLDEPVVLFRKPDGTPVALADRCCHRGLPLSMGRLGDDRIVCGYHGLAFDFDGACIAVPGQGTIPPGARVRAYPVAEKWGWVWIWMGDPARADEASIPDWPFLDDPEWAVSRGKMLHIKGNYQLINDNLMDLSHVSFVHGDSIGTAAVPEFPIRTERREKTVHMSRWTLDRPAPPFFQAVGGFNGNVDRWQIVETHLPCCTAGAVGCAPTGTGAQDGERVNAIEMYFVSIATPETATTTFQFYCHPRKFAVDDDDMTVRMSEEFRRIFLQDVAVIDAQQANMARMPVADDIDINVDAPGIAVRRMLAEKIAEEAAAG